MFSVNTDPTETSRRVGVIMAWSSGHSWLSGLLDR